MILTLEITFSDAAFASFGDQYGYAAAHAARRQLDLGYGVNVRSTDEHLEIVTREQDKDGRYYDFPVFRHSFPPETAERLRAIAFGEASPHTAPAVTLEIPDAVMADLLRPKAEQAHGK